LVKIEAFEPLKNRTIEVVERHRRTHLAQVDSLWEA
jgi:hypothetical protein